MRKHNNKSQQEFVADFGSWSFILGIAVAVLAGLSLPESRTTLWIPSLIIFLGFVSGLLNVTKKEETHFLIAAVALVLVTWFGGSVVGSVAIVGDYLLSIFNNILIFVVPAAIIVALKAIFSLESRA